MTAVPELPLMATFVLAPNAPCGRTSFAACAFEASGATLKCQ